MRLTFLVILLTISSICSGQIAKYFGRIPKNAKYVILVDFKKSITSPRLYLYDRKTGKLILSSLCAHGIGSGFYHPTSFSNKKDSHKSSVGLFKIGESYYGKFGKSYYLYGLSPDSNTNAYNRNIVLHSSKRMRTKWSAGCFSVPEDAFKIISKLQINDSYLLSYYE